MHDAMFNAIVRAPIDGPTASFLIATILGNDYFLSDDTLDAYRTSGTAHVLALSGMHVATLVMLSMLLLFPLSLIKRGRQYGQVALILLVWCYALATGLSPSVTRAATMLSVMALASIMQRVKPVQRCVHCRSDNTRFFAARPVLAGLSTVILRGDFNIDIQSRAPGIALSQTHSILLCQPDLPARSGHDRHRAAERLSFPYFPMVIHWRQHSHGACISVAAWRRLCPDAAHNGGNQLSMAGQGS